MVSFPDLSGMKQVNPVLAIISPGLLKTVFRPAYTLEAEQQNVDIHALLEQKAGNYKPGQSGLLALDWWNGNRSVLVDVDLTGLIIGATLATKPEEIYRASSKRQLMENGSLLKPSKIMVCQSTNWLPAAVCQRKINC